LIYLPCMYVWVGGGDKSFTIYYKNPCSFSSSLEFSKNITRICPVHISEMFFVRNEDGVVILIALAAHLSKM